MYNTPGVVPKSTIQGLQKDMKKGATGVALKGAFQLHLSCSCLRNCQCIKCKK